MNDGSVTSFVALFANRRIQIASLIVATVLILFARRPDQFLHPYMWVEDGRWTLPQYMDGGARIFLIYVSGYYITLTKLISYIAFSISISWAPEIQTALTVLCTCGVIVAIALSPTHLRAAPFCALAALLVPLDPEVFTIPAYAFWWAGFLLVLALLWKGQTKQPLRWFFVLLGGLSVPLAVSLFPLFVLRAAWERRRSEIIVAMVAAIPAAVQTFGIYDHRRRYGGGTFYPIDLATIQAGIELFVGGFLRVRSYAPIAVVMIALMAWRLRERLDRHFVFLVAIFAITCGSVALRIPLVSTLHDHPDPALIAPRYAFYPFVFLSWILIWLAAVSSTWARWAISAVLVAVTIPALPYMQRRADAIDWRAQLSACANSTEYQLPIHYNGKAAEAWTLKRTGEQCRTMLVN